MAMANLTLTRMVDLALGNPEVGSVNFNVMQTLFHAIIKKLNIGDHKVDFNKDRELIYANKSGEVDTQSEADSAVTGLGTTPSSASPSKDRASPVATVVYHSLERKLSMLEDKFDALNDLPSNTELFQRAQGDGEQPRPVSDMWQSMQMTRRVNANEQGVEKLMSLVEDLMQEMKKLRDQNAELQTGLQKALEEAAKAGKLGDSLSDIMNRLKDLEKQMSDINKNLSKLDKLDLYPDPEMFSDFVTWSSLEDALKGLQDSVNDLQNIEKRVVIDMSSQTGPNNASPESIQPAKKSPSPEIVMVSKKSVSFENITVSKKSISPENLISSTPSVESIKVSTIVSNSPKTSSSTLNQSRPQSSRSSTPGPSMELVNILEKLGKLSDEHDKLEERVSSIEEELKKKADKGALDGLGQKHVILNNNGGIPEDLLDQLKDLNVQLETLKKGQLRIKIKCEEKHVYIPEVKGAKAEEKVEEKKEEKKKVEEIKVEEEKVEEKKEEKNVQIIKEVVKIVEVKEKVNEYKLKDDETYLALFSDVTKAHKRIDDVNEGLTDLRESFLTMPDPVVYVAEPQPAEPQPEPEQKAHESVVKSTPSPVELAHKKSSSFEDALSSLKSDLKQKLRMVSQDASRQLADAREKLSSVEAKLQNMSDELKDLAEKCKSGGKAVDNDALNRMQQAIVQLQSELERLSHKTQDLVDESSNHRKGIEKLVAQCSTLEESKADKEFVQTEVEVKADKRHLDGKVNRSLFDSTCDDLNKMINDILSKLMGHEDEWKKALGQLTDDIDGKLDRLEFGPIRDELERQLKALLKRLNNLRLHDMEDDDAAGIRKQMVQRFHCISCDRPVDMAPQGPIPSIPASSGLPATKSTRPYTTFELDTIRQHAKRGRCINRYCKNCRDHSKTNFERTILEREAARARMHDSRAYFVHYGNDIISFRKNLFAPAPAQVDVMDLFATERACGGSHTLTYPQRRMTRLTQMNTLFREEEYVPGKEIEMEVQGADGHIYKGRNEDKLPHLAQVKTSPTVPRKVKMPFPPSNSQSQGQPPSLFSPRPSSARAANAMNAHGNNGSRPSSATTREIPHTDVPTGREFSTPPPAPAPSEPDPQSNPVSQMATPHVEQMS